MTNYQHELKDFEIYICTLRITADELYFHLDHKSMWPSFWKSIKLCLSKRKLQVNWESEMSDLKNCKIYWIITYLGNYYSLDLKIMWPSFWKPIKLCLSKRKLQVNWESEMFDFENCKIFWIIRHLANYFSLDLKSVR